MGYDEGLIKIFDPSSYRGYLWNKIFRLSEIRKYEIRFLPGVKIWEDTLFLIEYIINSSAKILYKHTPLYVYSIYPDSTMGRMDHSKHLTMIKCTNKLLNNLLLPENLYKIVVKLHAELLIEAVIFGTGSVKNDSEKEIKNYRKYLDKKKRCVYTVYALCPLVAALTNLALNLILVQFIGVYGILISTVFAIICVGMPWLLHNLFTVIFEKKQLLGYLKKLLYYCCVIFVSCIATYFVCSKVNIGLIATLVIRGAICVIFPNLIYLLAYYKRIEFTDSLLLVNKMTKGKLRGFLTKLGMRE